MNFSLGDILLLAEKPCVVVGLSGQVVSGQPVPDDHLAVWFGDGRPAQNRLAELVGRIEVWTVPADYFDRGPTPIVSH